MFESKNKELILTKQGEILRDMATGLWVNNQLIYEALENSKHEIREIKFGATLTIGEYIIPEILKWFIVEFPNRRCTMLVNNTERLLQILEEGKVDFIFVEGDFPKKKFEHRLFSKEECIGISGVPLQATTLEELFNQTIICGEEGSGSRMIVNNLLGSRCYSIDNFNNVIEVGNINVVKEIVKANLGISFCYKASVVEELRKGELYQIPLNVNLERECCFVTLKNNLFLDEYMTIYMHAKKMYEGMKKNNEI